MLTYDFSSVDGPLYEYIYRNIRADILSGVLRSNEKLPSKRAFARNNGVSSITIQNAYDQLIGEGFVYTIPKKGYYVAPLGEVVAIPKGPQGSVHVKLPPPPEKYEIDLSGNQSDFLFPFTVWAKLLRDVVSHKSRELMQPSPTGGKHELRLAIAEHLKSFRGMTIEPDQIVVGAGSEYLYSLVTLLLGTDKTYCVENPGYKKLVDIYKRHNVTYRYVDLDEKGIAAEGLRKSGGAVAHISPNHHFPSGVVMPASRRYEVLAWANEERDRYIIEDDYDGEFRSNGKPIPTLFSIDGRGKVVYMNTFSKSLAPTIRIAYMVLPERLANRFYEELSFYSCTVSNFEQLTLAEFLARGYFEKHINRTRLFYARRRKEIVGIFERGLDRYGEIYENEAGLHFLLKLNTEISDDVVTARLKAQGVRLHALSEYYFTPHNKSEHKFIVNYSGLEPSKAASACEKIVETIKEN